MGELGVCIIPTSIESLPQSPFLNHHSLCIFRKSGEAMRMRMFIKQRERTQQLLNSIQQKPLAPTHMISILQAELTNLHSVHTSYRPLILAATQLLKNELSFNGVSAFNRHAMRSVLPFLGDALSWLTGTATTKDVSSIQEESQPNDYHTTQTTRHSSPYHLCFKHDQICHSGEKTTHQQNDGCSGQDTPGHHYTLQHHKFTAQRPELPA